MSEKIDNKENKEMDFESAFRKLSQCAEELNDPNVSLNDAIARYKSGLEYYRICTSILDEARQLIQVYDRQNDQIREAGSDV